MIPERMSEFDTKLYQNLSAICPQYRGKNISDEEINNIAIGLVIVKGTPVIKQIRVTQANAKPDPLIVKLLRCLCSEQMSVEPKVNLQVPPAPPMPPAPPPPAPFVPSAPEPMSGIKQKKQEPQSQIEEEIEHLKIDKLFEDQVVGSDLVSYESEEFFIGQSDEDLAGYLEEVRDTCEGMLEVGLMPADFANQMIDRLGGLASAIGDEVNGVDAITKKIEVIITQYQQAIERMNSEIADLAIDELLGMPSDEQVKSEIARISKQDTSIDEKREFLKKLDKSSWKEAHLTRCKRLTSIESPMGSIRFNNEFSSLIKDLGRTLVNGIKEQSIVMEDQSLQITEPLKNEVRERVEVERITSILDIGKRAVLRSNLLVDEKQLNRAVNSFAKAFVIDCHSARPQFISTFDLNREQIEKFFLEEGIDVENIDKIVAILVDELRQQYSDGVSKRVADERSNPNSEQNKLAVNAFREVLEQLSLAAENMPTQYVKDFIDHLGGEFEKSVRNQSNMVDNAKEVLRQVERADKYTLIENRPFAAGAFGSVYKLAARNSNEPTHVLKILGTSIPKKEWDRYHQEGELVAKRIEHENVLSLNDVLLDDKGAIIGLIGPYMSGGDLSYIEKLNSPISEDQAMLYLSDMAKGIQALHDNGVAHLDLNLGNFLMEGNLLRVMDFGTSRVVGVRGEVRVDPGKRQYSAPEEERGVATTKSDCFSFGMLMYRMLEGKSFDRRNIVFRNIKDENLKALITGFLQPEPNNRPPVSEFLRYLENRK